jgi:ribosomal protein S12 methylthiotransferase accessory factor
MPLLTEVSRSHLDRIVGLWDDLVDPKVGIIQRVEELSIDDDDPDFFHYFSKACDTARFADMTNFSENGGASTDRHVAIAKAMGEAVERYCSAIYDSSEFVFASFPNLTGRAVSPALLSAYRADQFSWPGFQWHPFPLDTSVHWTRGISLRTGEPVWIPAAAVYVPFHFQGKTKSAFVMQPISTGMACGTTFEEAALSGLCEVVERDAFTITWQARLSRPRLDPATLPDSALDRIARFTAVGIDVKLMDITTDLGVPTILSIALTEAETSPAVAVSAATDSSPERAIRKSLEELAHTRKYAKQLMQYTPPIPVNPDSGFAEVKDQREHLRFYCPKSALPFAEFAWASPDMVPFSNLPDLTRGDTAAEIQTIVQNLAAAGLEPVAVEMTTPDIAALGLRVVRVVVPGAHPLYMGHLNRALGVQRLYEVPQKLGYAGLTYGDADNFAPHPFP